MGKTPHLDFQNRSEIDGSEELYTQNEGYNPKEQKFTVNQLAGFILSQLGDGQNGNASGANGLNGIGTIELGGNLNKPTTVNAGDFNLNLKKGSVQLVLSQTDKEGNQSANLLGENTNGNFAQMAATKIGQARLMASNSTGDTFSKLILASNVATFQ
ncbi:MAG: hypothetical protein NXI23_14535 [Bacteroidetes bacterium]|nr:hypothetical protein [Bacteroidota bacterium]